MPLPENMELQKCRRADGLFKFSILVPSWNNLSYLKLCVESIRKNSAFKHQILIHINEGTDGTLEWIQSQPDIDYSFSKANIGICYSLNFLRTMVAADYIVYMNDDMYVCPGWDSELMSEIDAIGHNRFFLSSTVIEPNDTGNRCVIIKNYGTDIDTYEEDKLLSEFRQLQKHDWMGATWPPNIVHRDIWDMVGGYSIEFSPGYYSDPDFSMKLLQIGVRVFKGVAKSRAYHFGSKTLRKVTHNKGSFTFVSKWKISSGTLTKFFLHRGVDYSGNISLLPLPVSLKLKSFYKQILALLKG